MLVLNRKLDERIVIGEGANAITLVVLRANRGVAKLGIEAPADVPIWREELLEAAERDGAWNDREVAG